MAKESNVTVGKIGEEIARDYLQKKGYKILEQNYRTKFGEIDLVAKDGKELVFVEVRTKTGEDFGTPEESLNYRKLQKIWLNARAYAAIHKWQGPCRIDAVCIVLRQAEHKVPERVDHYQGII